MAAAKTLKPLFVSQRLRLRALETRALFNGFWLARSTTVLPRAGHTTKEVFGCSGSMRMHLICSERIQNSAHDEPGRIPGKGTRREHWREKRPGAVHKEFWLVGHGVVSVRGAISGFRVFSAAISGPLDRRYEHLVSDDQRPTGPAL